MCEKKVDGEVRQGLTELPSGWVLLIWIIVLGWEIDVRVVLCLVPGIAISVWIHVPYDGASGKRKYSNG